MLTRDDAVRVLKEYIHHGNCDHESDGSNMICDSCIIDIIKLISQPAERQPKCDCDHSPFCEKCNDCYKQPTEPRGRKVEDEFITLTELDPQQSDAGKYYIETSNLISVRHKDIISIKEIHTEIWDITIVQTGMYASIIVKETTQEIYNLINKLPPIPQDDDK